MASLVGHKVARGYTRGSREWLISTLEEKAVAPGYTGGEGKASLLHWRRRQGLMATLEELTVAYDYTIGAKSGFWLH